MSIKVFGRIQASVKLWFANERLAIAMTPMPWQLRKQSKETLNLLGTSQERFLPYVRYLWTDSLIRRYSWYKFFSRRTLVSFNRLGSSGYFFAKNFMAAVVPYAAALRATNSFWTDVSVWYGPLLPFLLSTEASITSATRSFAKSITPEKLTSLMAL